MKPIALARRIRAPLRNHAYLVYFLLLAALTIVLLGFFLFVSYRQTEQTVAISSANEAHVLASQMEAALRRIQASSDVVVHTLLPEALAEHFSPRVITHVNSHLQALSESFPEIRGHRYYDAEGRLVFSSDPAPTEASIAKQPYYQQIRQQPKGLFFSATLPTIPLTLIASQAVLAADGTLQGFIEREVI